MNADQWSYFDRSRRIFLRYVFVLSVLVLLVGWSVPARAQISYIQGNFTNPQTSQTAVTVPYTLAQTAGNLNVVVVGWNDSTATITSITDSKGNAYAVAAAPVIQTGVATQAIYYAKNIVAAAAGTNTVTVTFSTAAAFADIRIAEYRGIDPVTPVDVSVGAQGNSSTSSSGAVTTTNANDLLVGANLVQTGTTAAGTGFTKRVITNPDGDILEDEVVTATGTYSVTAPISSGQWVMQMVAFRAAGSAPPPPDTIPPTTPTNLTVTPPIVQAVQSYINTNLQTTHTTAAFNSTGGDLIIVCASSHAGVTMTPSDSFNNTWTSAAGPTSTTTGFDLRTQVWYAQNPTVGANHTFTLTLSAAQSLVISIFVVKGSDVLLPIDAISVIGSDNGTQTTSVVSPNITTTGSNELLIGFAKSSVGETFTSGSGFTAQPSASSNFLDAETGSTSTPSTYNATFTLSTAATWQAVVIAVRPSAAQISLSWNASTDSDGDFTNYLLERCQGSGCTNFAQIATPLATNFTDTGVTPATSYAYRVRATDTDGNFSGYSNTATGLTGGQPPTAPGNLSATSTGPVQINLTWTAATEAGGTISQYLIERCTGSACTTFVQVGTSSTTSFSDAALSASTTYTYRVRAQDSSGVTGPYSATASATTTTPVFSGPSSLSATAASPVQVNLSWTAATETGGTITQYLIERCSGASCATFSQIATIASTATSFNDTGLTGSTSYSYRVRATDGVNLSAYSNIASATTLAPTFTAPSSLSATAPGSTQVNLSWAAGSETGGTISQYLIERCSGTSCTNFAQVGTVASTVTTFNDTGVTASTSYSYRVRATDGVTFSAYSNTVSVATPANSPSAPGNLSATASGPVQINLSWTASTETGGTISQYLIERCSGASCTTFSQIATVASPATSFSDTGLTGSTSYSYRVRAQDTSNVTGPYSNTASAATAAPTFTAPSGLTSAAASPAQISLSWTASTETGGTITQYSIERCSGASCTTFSQIATVSSTATSFNDTGLTGSTSYSYRVRATDGVNFSAYSNTASATTPAPTFTAPSGLTAAAASNTQINLSWTAATETGGTISQYLIERCSGPSCTSFAQVGTSTSTTYSDTGLTAATSYSYQVRATDAASNFSAYSNVATAITNSAPPQISYVQGNSADPQTSPTSVTVAYTLAQTAGDLNVVVVGWNNSTATVSSVTDTKGNSYAVAAAPVVQSGTASQVIYYAKSIAAAAAKGNSVTVTFSTAAAYPDIRIAEYSGLDPATPLDVSVGAQGNTATSNSGTVTTTNTNDLLVGANLVQTGTTAAGTGFTKRIITSPDEDILEDRVVTAAGSYSATAPVSPSGAWIMQMAAFHATAGGPVPPTVSSVSPNSGAAAGGTAVTITGTNFATGATVTFGSTAATNVVVTSSTTITATTPAGSAGAVTVTVTVNGQNGSLPNGFTYVVPPTVSSVSPSSGSTVGGTAVTITGTNFAAGATVTFGSTAATNVVVVSSTTITATTPAGSVGPAVTVTVTNPGSLSGSLSSAYTYVVVPTVSSVSPATGPAAGGTAVTIAGTNFAAGATVTFGSSAASNVVVVSSTTITATTPAGSAGAVTVTVTVNGQNGSLPNGFTYVVPPTVSSISPSSGSTAGGTAVTITGTNFAAGATVTFGSTAATNVVVVSSTTITATTPAGSVGPAVTVTVTNPGSLSGSLSSAYTYVVVPTVSSVSPATGPAAGGTAVTIAGTNFAAGATVTFGSSAASNVVVVSSTTITATAPAGSAGAVTVTVTVNGQNGSLPNGFTYVVPPTVSSISPSSGSTAGGTAVTITGTNFAAGATVTFGSTAATNVVVVNSTTITANTPAQSAGSVTVTVTNPGAQSGSLTNGFTYVVVTTITYVQGNSATPQTSQTTVNVTFNAAQGAGDLNVIVVGWNDSTTTVSAVTDKSGNTYVLAVGPTVQSGLASQSIYYARNIVGAAAGSNIVTVTFSKAATAPDIRILEYSGADPSNPVDVTAASSGSSATSSSGSVTTTNATDLVFGANLVQTATTGPGSGFTSRLLTSPDGDIAEDRMVTSTGSYSATAPVSPSGAWIMQMVAFRTAGSPPPPPILVTVSPTTTSTPSAYGTQVFTASLQNDPLNNGVTWSLSGSGCSGSTCGTLSNVTTTSVTYNAPATVPNPATVTITATSVTDNTKSASATITVTQGTLFISLSPKRAGLTLTQTQQFTATVYNDPKNGGVTWSVDGNNGGTATSGTISSTGLFTPGTLAGPHTVTATSNSNASINASLTVAVTDLAGVFTYHNDVGRTGQNLQEYALTPTTVNSSTFGPLFTCPVDGYIYAAPLYVANFKIGGQTRNVVFIATEHDSVYAFDADSPSCVQLWYTNFLSTGVTTVPPVDTGESVDLIPEIGITSTPVIDPSTNTLYVVPKTKETVGTGCSTSNPCYVHRLHALDTTTGAEKFGGPVVISAPSFVPLFHLQRPALLLNNGTVYIAFGSHGDNNTWQGWLMAYNAATLAQQWVWSSTDPTNGNNEGAIWGGGNGPALDANGNIYVETGNGVYDGSSNFADSVVKLSPSGTRLDYFTPFDQAVMQQNDIDLGSSGPMILPDAVGSSAHPHVMIASGKVGIVYLLDQTNMGKYNSAANQDVGEVNVGFQTTNFDGGFFGQPAYWNGNIYTIIVGDSLRQYTIANGAISTVSSSNSANTYTFRGATPAISASNTTNGIVWVADITAYQTGGAVILDAFDATNVSNLFYSSPSSGSGAAVTASKFTLPTVANGKVYVGGQLGFTVFGLLPN